MKKVSIVAAVICAPMFGHAATYTVEIEASLATLAVNAFASGVVTSEQADQLATFAGCFPIASTSAGVEVLCPGNTVDLLAIDGQSTYDRFGAGFTDTINGRFEVDESLVGVGFVDTMDPAYKAIFSSCTGSQYICNALRNRGLSSFEFDGTTLFASDGSGGDIATILTQETARYFGFMAASGGQSSFDYAGLEFSERFDGTFFAGYQVDQFVVTAPTHVPLPAGIALLATGAAAFSAIRRRKDTASATRTACALSK